MKKHPIFLIVATVLIFWGWLVALAFGAEIKGVDVVPPGTLAVFESDLPGDFTILPAKGAMFAKDSGGKKVYFASPVAGEYTLLFFGIENEQPVITQKAFVVGSEDTPNNIDVKPAPKPAYDEITRAEADAAIYAMNAIVRGIDAGTIRTPQGARATFKKLLNDKVGTCSGGTCSVSENLQKAIAGWESTMDITTLEGIREGFAKIAEELK